MAGPAEMSFWDHLDVLRGTVFRSVLAVFLFSLIFLGAKTWLFGIVLAPSRPDFFLYRQLGLDFGMELINIDVSAQFFAHLKMAVLCGAVVGFPYLIYEVWKFIAPALYENEKRAVRGAFALSSVLFYLGVITGYCIVLPVCLMFFMNYSVSDSVVNTISLQSYVSMFISLVFLIGLVFEFPTVAVVLSRLGILTRTMLKRSRRHAFVAVLVLAALITPSDPVSMVVLSLPLYALYEFSILICRDKIETQ